MSFEVRGYIFLVRLALCVCFFRHVVFIVTKQGWERQLLTEAFGFLSRTGALHMTHCKKTSARHIVVRKIILEYVHHCCELPWWIDQCTVVVCLGLHGTSVISSCTRFCFFSVGVFLHAKPGIWILGFRARPHRVSCPSINFSVKFIFSVTPCISISLGVSPLFLMPVSLLVSFSVSVPA